MTAREEVHHLIEELSDSDLLVVRRMLRGLLTPEESTPTPVSAEERRARARAAYGSMAHTHTSVDEFLARKHEDTEWEEERYRRRHPEEQ